MPMRARRVRGSGPAGFGAEHVAAYRRAAARRGVGSTFKDAASVDLARRTNHPMQNTEIAATREIPAAMTNNDFEATPAASKMPPTTGPTMAPMRAIPMEHADVDLVRRGRRHPLRARLQRAELSLVSGCLATEGVADHRRRQGEGGHLPA